MPSNYGRVLLKPLLPHFNHWSTILARHEVGHICFAPKADTHYRSLQFQAWYSTAQHHPVDIITLEADQLDEPSSLPTLITSPTLIILNSLAISPQIKVLWHHLQSLHLQSPLSLLLVHDIFPSQLQASLTNYSPLNQNLTPFPLHTLDTVTNFIHQIAQEWHLTIPDTVIVQIYQHTSGYLWLVKEILRQWLDTPSLETIINNDTYLWKTQQIWQAVPSYYQHHLLFLSQAPTNITSELIEMNLLDSNFQLPGFLRHIIDSQHSSQLQLTQHQITLRGVNISFAFSSSERRVLNLFWQNHTTLVTRDQVAQAFWGRDWSSHYSDWAIDQLISRLRRKIIRYQLPLKVTTQRSLGYGLST